MQTIPARWAEVLRSLRDGGFPEAVVAGGALRDLDNCQPVKDVDIFVLSRGEHTVELLNEAFGYEGRAIITEPACEYMQMTAEVIGVYEYEATKPVDIGALDALWAVETQPPFQIVVIDPPGDLTTTFGSLTDYMLQRIDLGLCRIAFDGERVVKTDEYLRDQSEKTLSILRADNSTQLERTIRRTDRIREKYPTFRVVNRTATMQDIPL